MAVLEFFTVVSNGIGAIQIDYVDAGVDPDEEIVFAFVDFEPREPPGTVHWCSGLTPPRGIQLDPVRGRFSDQDGRLRTIIAHPENEKQRVTVTGDPFSLTYGGQTTAPIALAATPPTVQAALEALPNINPGDIYVSGKTANEKQLLTRSAGTLGGTFRLSLGGAYSDPISYNASASSVQAFLQALAEVGSEGCSVTGPTGGPWTVEFTGVHAGVNMPTLTADSSALLPAGNTITVSTTVSGTTGTPFDINFIGTLAATDIPLMTGTNCTITPSQEGGANLGVRLVANTAVLELGVDKDGNDIELLYDVIITVPDLDPHRVDRIIKPFAIAAPKVGGTVIDLADDEFHLPPKPPGWEDLPHA